MNMRNWSVCIVIVILAGLAGPSARAAWNPIAGEWGKDDPHDIRVMTYNIEDNVRAYEGKAEGYTAWCAIARIIAAMKPDVLLLQEAGDNGCYGCVDSVSELTTAAELLLYGGADPFHGGTVGAYVQKYDPTVDLPYIFVSSANDGYNRNVILSRFPFVDLNGDGGATRSDIHPIYPDEYAPGGNGGIRGVMVAELDLPDELYAGDLVILNAHLKAYSDPDSQSQRLRVAQNVAYYVDYFFNGAGTGTPDPHNKILDNPPATSILDDHTPVVLGGDWNEDESSNGRNGPAYWITRAQTFGGVDGTDRDRTDATYDASVDPGAGHPGTSGDYGSKLDYLAWQDSIVGLRRSFVFKSNTLGGPTWYPPELDGFPSPAAASALASDHRPVVADLMLPAAPPAGCPGDSTCDGAVNWRDIDFFVAAQNDNESAWRLRFLPGEPTCPFANNDVNGDGTVNWRDIDPFVQLQNTTCP